MKWKHLSALMSAIYFFIFSFTISNAQTECADTPGSWQKRLNNNTTYYWWSVPGPQGASIKRPDGSTTYDQITINNIVRNAMTSSAVKWKGAIGLGLNINFDEASSADEADIFIRFEDLPGPAARADGNEIKIDPGMVWTDDPNLIDPNLNGPGNYKDIVANIIHEFGHVLLDGGHVTSERYSMMNHAPIVRSFNSCDYERIRSIYDPYKTITANNSFGGGSMKIDGVQKTIPVNGEVRDWRGSTFPHTLEAVNENQTANGYVQKFDNNWVDATGSTVETDKLFSVNSPINSTATYTANFKNQYDVTFVNSVVGLGNVGTLRINGVEKNMPTSSVPVKQDYSVTAEGTAFVINGIKYLIDHWSDGPSASQRTFYPTNDTTYTAYYVGIPQMTTISINIDETGQPVRLNWSVPQNTNITQYRVYRGAKVDGNFSNPQIIAILSRNDTIYIDNEFVIGGSSPNSVAYDVVPYYSTEQTWGVIGAQIVSATKELLQKQNSEDGSEILADYILDNYPNPFNPSTKINFSLPEAGFVKLTIYDMLGRQVKELVNMQMNPGSYTSTWYGVNELGNKVNSGIYFSVLESRNKRIVQKMILSK